MVVAIVRVRGRTGIKPEIAATLNMLNLTRKNHCVIKDEKKIIGMLNKCKDYVTWGNISKEMLKALVIKRGRLTGDKKVPEDIVGSVVNALEKGEKANIKPVFRLRPPRKGWKSIKEAYPKGALGKRGSIDDLIKKMI